MKAIQIAPVPMLTGLAGYGIWRQPPQHQLKATGVYSDQKTEDVTRAVEWHSSRPDVLAIDKHTGLATVGHVSGATTVTATDPSSASLGVAIGGTTVVHVTIPALASIEISPAQATIAAGEKRQFSVTLVYSDNSRQDMKGVEGVVEWTADGSVQIDPRSGLATARTAGSATVTARHGDGKSASLKLKVEAERGVDTRFGRFTYVASQEAVVLPLIQKTIQTYEAALSLDLQLSEKFIQLTNAAKKLEPQAEIVKDVAANATENAGDKAAIALATKDASQALQVTLKYFKEHAQEAERELALKESDIAIATDKARATQMLVDAKEMSKKLHLIVGLGSAAADFHNPAKAIFDALGELMIYFNDKEFVAEANKLEREANALGVQNAATRFKNAQASLTKLAAIVKEIEPIVKHTSATYVRAREKTESKFDSTTCGEFRFATLNQLIQLADATHAALARQAGQTLGGQSETAYAALVAAEALARPSESPSLWMANPEQDQNIIRAFHGGAKKMFSASIARRDQAQAAREQLRATYDAALQALFDADASDHACKKK